MTTLVGTLFVQETDGATSRYLTFHCALGTFQVQCDTLDDVKLKAGEHAVFAEIIKIQQGFSRTANGFNCAPEVILGKVAFIDAQPQGPIILSTSASENKSEQCLETETETEAASAQQSLLDTHEGDVQLFGELWPLITNVKLDPAQSRERLLKQAERLKEMGYAFNQSLQTWQHCA